MKASIQNFPTEPPHSSIQPLIKAQTSQFNLCRSQIPVYLVSSRLVEYILLTNAKRYSLFTVILTIIELQIDTDNYPITGCKEKYCEIAHTLEERHACLQSRH
ncbi:hypothetical protein ACMFMG_011204 [Clarireedia jacksonii]